ncbi:MAG: hypothetical protein LBV04_01035 [Deferribacteraceae bacterium]|jgi:hypothetical protein|nr:hypothetical protein [Deferribacteraceae bacterium]
MMNNLKEQMRLGFQSCLPMIKVDIDNCPDALWEKKVGGDFYWQQVFHAISSTAGMLTENVETPTFPIPNELTFLEQYPGMPYITDYKGVHGKDLMYASLELTAKHIDTYFEKLDANDLFKMVDFFGTEMTLFNRLGATCSHIMYHVGALDAALRDHGAKGSM